MPPLTGLLLVTLLWNGQRYPQFSIEASAIIDLVLEAQPPNAMQRQVLPISMQDSGQQSLPPQPFADPAILHCTPAKGPDHSKAPSMISQPSTQPRSMVASAPQPMVIQASPNQSVLYAYRLNS